MNLNQAKVASGQSKHNQANHCRYARTRYRAPVFAALGVFEMKLLPDEVLLEGAWIKTENGVDGDETCKRIHWLIENSLEFVKSGNWEGVYLDTHDGRHWLVFYPQSELHGGGPPSMRVIDENEIGERFNAST